MEDRPPEFPPTPENPWSAPPPAPQVPPTAGYGGGPGWASPPPPPPPTAPHAPFPPPRRAGRGVGALLAVALAAGLIGGGVGAAVTYGVTNDDTPAVSSLTTKPITGTKTSANAPAGSVEQVAAKVLPSVVSIDVRGTAPSRGLMDLGGDSGSDQIVGSGSGVVISTDGLILTNNHVAENGELSVTFKDGRTVKAKLIKADKSSDLAVIKAQGISDAIPIAFGSSSDLVVGQQVVAVGSPLGLSGTVTSGIVSARERPVVTTQGAGSGDDGSVIDAIQTDAPINPGNSGGALVDMSGRLVGITSAIASLGSSLGGQSGSIGLGFAIPIDQARVIAAKLEKGETVAHPLLGVQVTGSPRPTQRGALIDQVTNGGAAEKAGLKKGDLIIQLDQRLIDTSDALVAGVRSKQPGDKVTVTYLRGNDTRKAEVVLGSDAKVTSS
jgi:putative serine protease PepD